MIGINACRLYPKDYSSGCENNEHSSRQSITLYLRVDTLLNLGNATSTGLTTYQYAKLFFFLSIRMHFVLTVYFGFMVFFGFGYRYHAVSSIYELFKRFAWFLLSKSISMIYWLIFCYVLGTWIILKNSKDLRLRVLLIVAISSSMWVPWMTLSLCENCWFQEAVPELRPF